MRGGDGLQWWPIEEGGLSLRDDQRVYRIPGVQILEHDDGRLLIRGPLRCVLRHGVRLAELEQVLAEVDGIRTAGEIAARLADRFVAADVIALLAALIGDVLSLEPAKPPSWPSIGLWGGGEACERWLAFGAARGWPAPTLLLGAPRAEDLACLDLLLILPDEVPLRTALQLQRQALRVGVLSLCLSGEAGQLLLGPPILAGASACLACCRLEPFAGALGDAPATLRTLGRLIQQLNFAPAALQRAFALIATTIEALAANRLRDFRSVWRIAADGHAFSGHQTRRGDCPICGAMTPQVGTPLLGAVLESHKEVSQRFVRSAAKGESERLGSVCVLGGGTAGFLAALALKRDQPRRAVTLIHSSALPIIGVGEATTPLMPQFLHADLGLDPVAFFRAVQPTLKLGIRFDWDPSGRAFSYPFGPLRLLEAAVHGRDLDSASGQAMLMAEGRVPFHRQGRGGRWLDLPEMAYHLDNPRLARFLAEEAARSGVTVLDRQVRDVVCDPQRTRVLALVDDGGQRHEADFYLDCSGFAARLLGEALEVPFQSFAGSLFTDRAVVGPVPSDAELAPFTRAIAMNHGWCWEIPQGDERHVGYVYCSAFVSDDQAEAELRARFPGLMSARRIPFRPGRRVSFVKGNVAALGNAYGFVEPLESTSLHLLIRQLGLLLRTNPFDRVDHGLAPLLNRQVNGWWDYLRFFLALHFRFNQGPRTPFWQHCREQVILGEYAELVELFQCQGPLSANPGIVDSYPYPDPLWGPEGVDTLLLGMGLACPLPQPGTSATAWRRWQAETRAWVGQMAPAHEAFSLTQADEGLMRQLAGVFRGAGPAFR